MNKYLLEYKDKTESGIEGINYREFDSLFKLVGFIYDYELNENPKFRVFEQKTLNISLGDIQENEK